MSAHVPFVIYEVDPFQENLSVYGKRCSSYTKCWEIFALVTSNILLYAILSEIYLVCIPL